MIKQDMDVQTAGIEMLSQQRYMQYDRVMWKSIFDLVLMFDSIEMS